MNAGLVILSCIIYLRIVEYIFSAVSSAHFDYVYKCSHTKIKLSLVLMESIIDLLQITD